MNTFLKKIKFGGKGGFVSVGVALFVFFAAIGGIAVYDLMKGKVEEVKKVEVAVQTPEVKVGENKLGANGTEIPTSVALFETSLSTAITTSATSMTLVSATDKAGTTFASSTYAFILDEGTASEEMVLADCTSTACANMIRGLSPLTGTTTVATLKFAHRRGASVKITDGPQLLILSRITNGIQGIPNKLFYTSAPTFLNGNELVSKTYVDATAFGSTPVTVTSGGTGQTTLPLNMLLVGNGTTAITATSSPTVAYIVATSTTATSTFAGAVNFTNTTATSTFSSGIAVTGAATSSFASGIQITGTGKGIIFPDATIQTSAGITVVTATTTVFTSSGTWVKPSGITKVMVELIGGGGGGGGATGSAANRGGGGGGGGYARAIISVTGNVTVTVGDGGVGGVGNATGATGGTSSFAGTVTVSAIGGTGGLPGTGSDAGGTAGAGGSTTNADFGIVGQFGWEKAELATNISGTGGNSIWGYGAKGVVSGNPTTGGTGALYGGGGSGSYTTSAVGTGGAGGKGIVVVTWYQ